jgi:transketolase N-terminal domain/subunit
VPIEKSKKSLSEDKILTHNLDQRSLHLREMVLDTLISAGRGHPGPALSLLEILRVLYDDILDMRSA